MVAVPYQKVHIGGKIEVAKRTQEAGIKERVSSRKNDTTMTLQKYVDVDAIKSKLLLGIFSWIGKRMGLEAHSLFP
jgi:acyl-ACP thioesterase